MSDDPRGAEEPLARAAATGAAQGGGDSLAGPRRRQRERPEVRQQRHNVALPAIPAPRGPLGRRVYDFFHVVERRAAEGSRRRYWIGAYALRVFVQVIRQSGRDRCPQQAAALAFQTVLSVVPLLAVALAALRLTGHMDAESSLVDFLAREFVPVSREVIANQLTEWSDNVSLESLGAVGLITTVLLAFVTVISTETSVNGIWRAEHKRSLTQKFVVFYATITIGPFLIGTSLYQAARFGLTEGWTGLGVGVATSFGALFLANYLLPAVPVRARAAALGALVSTLLFEGAKYAFSVYVTSFAFKNYAGVYGTLAVVPLWLVWIYYSWLVFLLGVEVAHAAQNLHLLQRSDRLRPMSLENEIVQRVNGVLAARIMAAISAAYVNGDKVMPRRAIEEIFDLSSDALTRIVERLKQSDLVIEVEGELSGLLPARPPSEIALSDVLAAFRGEDIQRLSEAPRSHLERVLAEIEEGTRSRTTELYFDELVGE